VIGIRDLDLRIHPPPDLVVEIERQGMFSKQAAYEAIGVPELWQVNDESIRFLVRSTSGVFVEHDTSLAFPMVNSAELSQVYFTTDLNDDITMMDAAREWASNL
jgi:Uma2 family endonuclease